MFIHDVIKQKYSQLGYLPNYPPHLLSLDEMFSAFMPLDAFDLEDDQVTLKYDIWLAHSEDVHPYYFIDNYPLIDPSLVDAYKNLISEIAYHILTRMSDSEYSIPSWVYSYMIGEVICNHNEVQDIHDLLVMMNCDNMDDIFNEEASRLCYTFSTRWVNNLPESQRAHRPATIFGELHVIKYLRLRNLS